jgi:hypothetical protein
VSLDLNLRIDSSNPSHFIRLIPLVGRFRTEIKNPASVIASRVRRSCRQSEILFTDCCSDYFHFGAINATIGIRIETIVREEIANLSTPVTSVFLSGIGGIHRSQLIRLLSLIGTPTYVAIFSNLGSVSFL